jgi:PAS domain S-box-containing protein
VGETLLTTPRLLAAWREADRRWEREDPSSATYRESAIAVVRAWLAYHLVAGDLSMAEITLVVDDDRRFVAASPNVTECLGYQPDDLLARRVDDLTDPDVGAATDEQWHQFVLEGRQEGTYPMLAADGTIRPMQFQARAHFPIAGFHLSRLWAVAPTP